MRRFLSISACCGSLLVVVVVSSLSFRTEGRACAPPAGIARGLSGSRPGVCKRSNDDNDDDDSGTGTSSCLGDCSVVSLVDCSTWCAVHSVVKWKKTIMCTNRT